MTLTVPVGSEGLLRTRDALHGYSAEGPRWASPFLLEHFLPWLHCPTLALILSPDTSLVLVFLLASLRLLSLERPPDFTASVMISKQ